MQSRIMVQKLNKLLVISLALIFLPITHLAIAAVKSRHIDIVGFARFANGEPIRGADILLLEGRIPKPNALPSFVPFARAVTDASGKYVFSAIKRKKWIIVELIRDKCEWFSQSVPVSEEELRSLNKITVDLVSKHDACKDRSP